MRDEQIQEKIRTCIIECLGVHEDQVTPGTKLMEDLGADSLDCVELIMHLEEEFDIEIEDEQAEKIKTVEDAFTNVKHLLGTH